MTFGKFKGAALKELPDDYLEWLLGLEGLRSPLREQLEAEWQQRHGPPPAPGSLLDLVNAGFRALAHRHHPDHGGDPKAMREAIQSYEYLRRLIETIRTKAP